jgi:hypothetical protein
MQWSQFLVSLLVVTAPAAAQDAPKQPIGIFFGWGAFEQSDPRKCYAIARPNGGTGAGSQSFASIGSWPEQGVRSQLHIRLSRAKRAGSAVILKVDDRSFQLLAGGVDAWAPDAGADARIVAAMRTGVKMSIETRSQQGKIVRDRYSLRGAATAIDAAAIACARQPS